MAHYKRQTKFGLNIKFILVTKRFPNDAGTQFIKKNRNS